MCTKVKEPVVTVIFFLSEFSYYYYYFFVYATELKNERGNFTFYLTIQTFLSQLWEKVRTVRYKLRILVFLTQF